MITKDGASSPKLGVSPIDFSFYNADYCFLKLSSMKIDNNTGEIITLDEAVEYTHAFQKNNPDALKAFFVGRNKINRILEQNDCIGVRIYNGLDAESGKNNLVLVGVDAEGEDITEGIILEKLTPCPKYCAKSSPLISE